MTPWKVTTAPARGSRTRRDQRVERQRLRRHPRRTGAGSPPLTGGISASSSPGASTRVAVGVLAVDGHHQRQPAGEVAERVQRVAHARALGQLETTRRPRLFAMLRERAGAGQVVLELPEGARVRDALDSLGTLADGLPLVMAVNREYADADQVLGSGDELALIPPVSGGQSAPHALVVQKPLSLDALAARVRDPRAGAVVTFQGVTRAVERLEYEAYVEMAEEKMAAIANEAVKRHALCAAAVEHRIGDVPLSEPSVAVAVSAPHRGPAFAGAREIIDRVKAEAPIWKKEVDGGTTRWVEGAKPG